jgi:hypothetical protein
MGVVRFSTLDMRVATEKEAERTSVGRLRAVLLPLIHGAPCDLMTPTCKIPRITEEYIRFYSGSWSRTWHMCERGFLCRMKIRKMQLY